MAPTRTMRSGDFQRLKFRMRAAVRGFLLISFVVCAAVAVYASRPTPQMTEASRTVHSVAGASPSTTARRLNASDDHDHDHPTGCLAQPNVANIKNLTGLTAAGGTYDFECMYEWKTGAAEKITCSNGTWSMTYEGDDVECVDWYDGYKAFAFGMDEDGLKGGGVIVMILLSLYMFLALSIVCDEYFVPALERMADAWNISDEIAGATLMAAGGSAPELFTSFIGTFTESSVGFGTIVGSAVFNVLFVIGMCAICSTGELKLTSWPLVRDSSYYCLSLVVLAVFFGVLTENEIWVYESAILFIMYIGYVMVMANNENLHQALWSSKKKKIAPAGEGDTAPLAGDDDHDPHGSHSPGPDNVSMNTPFTFRAGILQMMAGQSSAADLAGAYAVTKIKGTMKQTFKEIDGHGSGDGCVDAKELKGLLQKVVIGDVTDQMVEETLTAVDTNKNGTIDLEEFKAWYKSSAHAVKHSIHAHFHDLDIEGSGLMKKIDTINMLRRLRVEDIELAEKECHAEAKWTAQDEIDKEEFTDWFLQSKYLAKALEDHQNSEAEGAEALTITWPEGMGERIMFIIAFPLMITLYFTVPDVRNPRFKAWFVPAFTLAIVWIGVYSYVMVAWITLTGNTFGIPVQVMGLTFLAAGTSIPDLLSSVIVARKGLGDMAVSSSIGSNIFDVLVGLPVPWLAYGVYKGIQDEQWYTAVVADTLFVSLLILFIMIGAVISLIICQKWVMTKTLGMMMFVLYFVFVAQDLARGAM